MLHLRVFGDAAAMADVAQRLDALAGVRHVSVAEGVHGADALVTADLRAAAADRALALLEELGIPAEDFSLLRFDAIDPTAGSEEAVAVVWADLLGQARLNARTAVRYLVFMAVAGVIAVVWRDRTGPDPDYRRDGGGARPAPDHRDLHGPGPRPPPSDSPWPGLAARGTRPWPASSPRR